uniref:Uncharacterized protein n=1 Tax=Phage sp. ctgh419 TaxID=2828009 RepID=A0A8S5SKN9_9VIRU|nr:MAG TPA: hypothetical protein [Phage sp. ctgh419]
MPFFPISVTPIYLKLIEFLFSSSLTFLKNLLSCSFASSKLSGLSSFLYLSTICQSPALKLPNINLCIFLTLLA